MIANIEKCEFKHDKKSDTNDQMHELKRALNELFENRLMNTEKIIPLEKCKGNKSKQTSNDQNRCQVFN